MRRKKSATVINDIIPLSSIANATLFAKTLFVSRYGTLLTQFEHRFSTFLNAAALNNLNFCTERYTTIPLFLRRHVYHYVIVLCILDNISIQVCMCMGVLPLFFVVVVVLCVVAALRWYMMVP